MQLFAHAHKVFVDFVPERRELEELHCVSLYFAVLVYTCGDIHAVSVMLHGDYDTRVFEHEALHLFVFRAALFAEVFAALGCKGGRLCGHIEHTRRRCVTVERFSVIHEREKIDKHLHIKAVNNIGNGENLARRLVIYNSYIRLSVYSCEVYPVHLAGDVDISAGGHLQLVGHDSAVMRYVELEVNGIKVAVSELVRKPCGDCVYAAREPLIEIEESL